MPLGYTLSPLKLMRGKSNMRSLLGSSFNCWKSEKIDDVYGATVVHEDPFGVESLYSQHYDQRVIVRLLHSFGICFIEGHILVRLFLLKRRYHVDVIHLSLACFLEGFEWPSCEWPFCNRLSLSNHILGRLGWMIITPGRGLMLALIAISELTIFPFLHIFL